MTSEAEPFATPTIQITITLRAGSEELRWEGTAQQLGRSPDWPETLRTAHAFIEQNLDNTRLSLATVADGINTDKTHLARLFRKTLSTTCNTYIRLMRENRQLNVSD